MNMKKLLLVTLLVVALSAVNLVAFAEADITASYANGAITVDVAGAGEQATVIVLDGAQANNYLEGVNAETLADFYSKAVYVGQAASVEGTARFDFLTNANLVSEEVTIYAAGTDASAVVETLSLVEEAAVYNITYDYAGAEAVADAPTTYEEGATVALPVPTKDGYTFAGWLVNGAGDPIATTEGQDGDLALVASWTVNVYTITYDYAGAEVVADAATSYEHGATVALPVPTKVGYTFAGWKVNGEGNAINTTEGLTGNLNLVASWAEVLYSITYDYAGAEAVVGAATSYQQGATGALPVPTKIGYTFDGWFVNGEGEAIATTEGQDGNLELVARWTMILGTAVTDIADNEDGFSGGVYTKVGEEGTFGVLSVTATLGEGVVADKIGFLVYGGGNVIQTAPVVVDETVENGFYTVLYNIAEANFDSVVIFKPYIMDAEGEYQYGEGIELKVADFVTNDLGTDESLGFVAAE